MHGRQCVCVWWGGGGYNGGGGIQVRAIETLTARLKFIIFHLDKKLKMAKEVHYEKEK